MDDARFRLIAAVLTLAVTVMLGGCVTDFERCQSYGFQPGTSGMNACLANEQRLWDDLSRSSAESAAAGAAYLRAVTPQAPVAPTQCISRRYGTTTQTQCY